MNSWNGSERDEENQAVGSQSSEKQPIPKAAWWDQHIGRGACTTLVYGQERQQELPLVWPPGYQSQWSRKCAQGSDMCDKFIHRIF